MPIPVDLVTLPDHDGLTAEQIQKVLKVPWYKCDGVLLASFKDIDGLSEDAPEDSGVDLNHPIKEVASVLHRHSPASGFYSA